MSEQMQVGLWVGGRGMLVEENFEQRL